jgi:flagellar biosynthesis/type III secretory pathway protein FliH
MISSLRRPAVHGADAAFARWSPGELRSAPPAAAPVADAEEQDALIEAIAEAAAAEAAAKAAAAEAHRRDVEAAYRRGHEEGREAGARDEAERLRSAVAAAEAALGEVQAKEAQWTGAIEENVCALAVAVARHLLGRELAQAPESVAELVRRALAEFPLDQPLRIRMHPSDLVALSVALDAEGEPIQITAGREASWLADPRVEPGGCVVEGRDRIVDGRVDTALERVYRQLTQSHA